MRIAFSAALLALAVSAVAHEGETAPGYWGDNTSKSVWKNAYGECWQNGNITKEQAAAGCEPKPAPKPAPVVVAPPPPPPAPVVVAPPPPPAPVEAPAPAPVAAAPLPIPMPVVPVKPVDTDGDGVPDADDKCNDTKKGAKVDETGCYIILKEKVTVSINVKFPSGSSKMDAAGEAEAKKLADFMTEYPKTTIEVGGHTDSSGNAATNKKLSQARADAVRKVVIEKYGIEADRVTAVGYGSEQPIADNNTAEGRVANRRVEGVVSKTIEKIAQ